MERTLGPWWDLTYRYITLDSCERDYRRKHRFFLSDDATTTDLLKFSLEQHATKYVFYLKLEVLCSFLGVRTAWAKKDEWIICGESRWIRFQNDENLKNIYYFCKLIFKNFKNFQRNAAISNGIVKCRSTLNVHKTLLNPPKTTWKLRSHDWPTLGWQYT